ncbi:ABC transporter ATP-binding protein [Haladaptatus sp. DYF46]|uniref:dipeptide ABC transporter ATP-binding protein n=1 Tax=Haladaptatus sp. DYF46 TaxID=2886041 RepID=UPI001E479E1E|nr:ABC transporter ATP-binding protein [Haladaptatus sp. DYF46]
MTLLDVDDLEVRYDTSDESLHSVNGVSFTIEDGVNYALSGESASGKSTTAKAILGLLPDHAVIESGRIEFEGRDLRSMTPAERQDLLWEEIAFIPQTAIDALDPTLTVGGQICQAIRTHRTVSERSAKRRARELFETVGLNPGRTEDYPHQFSDGMRQRVVIAMALALDPKLIIADEPTTGLDVIVQDEIIDNILKIQEETDSSLLLITHDLSVIAETCDEMSVLYGGMVMEQGCIDNLLLNPSNPYTMGLKNAYPALDAGNGRDLVAVPGKPPNLDSKPTGCVFESRCPFATDACSETVPELEKLPYRNQRVACHHVERSNRMRSVAEDPSTWGGIAEGYRTRDGEVLLEVEELSKWYKREDSLLGSLPIDSIAPSITGLTGNIREWWDQRGEVIGTVIGRDESHVRAVDGVSLSVSRGEILGIVGESGCGKSTLGETLALLEDPTVDRFTFDGRSYEYYRDDLQLFRRKLQIIFQNPYESLNPRMTVEQLVKEPLTIHGYRLDERETAVEESLEQVGLAPAERYLDTYPNELSGGQRQRVAIARALVIDPDLLICDEPASMLDVSLQAEVLNLLRGLANTEGIGVLYISHDLASLSQIADRMAIMYLGQFVERGRTEQIVTDPQHPYTEALLAAVPETDPRGNRERITLDGKPALPSRATTSCQFAPRCPKATDCCWDEDPGLAEWTDDRHSAACFHPADDTLDGEPDEKRIDTAVESD